jgi:hypothetical protein
LLLYIWQLPETVEPVVRSTSQEGSVPQGSPQARTSSQPAVCGQVNCHVFILNFTKFQLPLESKKFK